MAEPDFIDEMKQIFGDNYEKFDPDDQVLCENCNKPLIEFNKYCGGCAAVNPIYDGSDQEICILPHLGPPPIKGSPAGLRRVHKQFFAYCGSCGEKILYLDD